MGEGLGGNLIAYLDTHILLWVLDAEFHHLSDKAAQALDDADLLVSPVVMLELEYLFEIQRTNWTSRDARFRMERYLNAKVCDLPFPRVAEAALDEKWTRDPFDRLIVAQAKANGLAPLISADERMRKHYPGVLW